MPAMPDDRPSRQPSDPYPPIGDYALVGDCHSLALVSRGGSVDWCCVPRMDRESCFGRLLDWAKGGYCSIAPAAGDAEATRTYLDGSLILETRFETASGEVRLLDGFAMRLGGREEPYGQLLRIVEGVRGEVEMAVEIAPRFSYGEIKPWIRHHGARLASAIGGDLALVLEADFDLEPVGEHDLRGRFTVGEGERWRLSIRHAPPHRIHPGVPRALGDEKIDKRFAGTLEWWRRWSRQGRGEGPYRDAVLRSAVVIKALTNAPTGAIAAAATTSLPESLGGGRNWDYRYTWVRDSSFALGSLMELGFEKEATGFRYFMERTTAGNVEELRVLYGIGGETRLVETTLDDLEGYRGSRPVRLGNAAYAQLQLDIYGELLLVAWEAACRHDPPDEVYWRFLRQVVDRVTEVWETPDRGIWEVRGEPLHFVHSKVMCWAALDCGLRLAEACGYEAPAERWREARETVRKAVEEKGYDRERGIFVRAFGHRDLDASLLLLPRSGFLEDGDERMVRTVDAIRRELSDDHGLLRRYRSEDGIEGEEGVFLACSFWLVEVLARQGRRGEAVRLFDHVSSLANDLGLFAEEHDPRTGALLGNFPQGLSHYSHIGAALALAEAGG